MYMEANVSVDLDKPFFLKLKKDFKQVCQLKSDFIDISSGAVRPGRNTWRELLIWTS